MAERGGLIALYGRVAVGQLRELTHLELQDNVALDNIPASFADLTKLVVFNFSNTTIPALPYELQFWTELTELTGTRNAQIEEVPGTYPDAADIKKVLLALPPLTRFYS